MVTINNYIPMVVLPGFAVRVGDRWDISSVFVNQFERRLQRRHAVSRNPADRATLDLQFALDRQMAAARLAVKSLPAGLQHAQFAGELATLQSNAIHVLRGLLPGLAQLERLATTGELG